MRDSLGVPLQPEEQPHVYLGCDWLGQAIYSDDMDDYIEYEGDYILDDADHIRAYLLENGVVKNTTEIYEEMIENG